MGSAEWVRAKTVGSWECGVAVSKPGASARRLIESGSAFCFLFQNSHYDGADFVGGLGADGDDFFAGGRFGIRIVGAAFVGDGRQGQHAQAGVDGDDGFGNGGHADDVAADLADEALFGAGFVIGAGDGDISALVGDEVRSASDFQGAIDEVAVVGLAHVGEARAEGIVVDADERVGVHEVYVIVHDHDVAAFVERIQSAGCVRDDKQVDAEGFHHADGQGDLPGGVAFVEMEAALHGDDGQAGESAANELAFVADGSGDGEVRNIFVGNFDGGLDRFR